MVSQDDLDRLTWAHTITLKNGLITNGASSYTEEHYSRFLFPKVKGLTVADFGTADGFWAIEAKKNGAAYVEAHDVTDRPTARLALSDYGISYSVGRDLNVPQTWPTRFHVVLFYGIIYHLHNPVQGLRNVFDLVHPGGTLVVESAVDSGEASEIPACIPALWITPIEGWAGDYSNVFIPNREGLRQLCRNLACGKIVDESTVDQCKSRMTIKISKPL